MLWLSGLMGLLAVGAFTLLCFLPMRRREDEEPEDAFDAEDGDATALQPLLIGFEETAPVCAGDSDARVPDGTPIALPDALLEAGRPDMDETPDACAQSEMRDALVESLRPDVEPGPDVLNVAVSPGGAEPGPSAPEPRDMDAQSAQDVADWFLAGRGTATFDDFDPQEDDLVVVWDDTLGSVPDVQVLRNDEDPGLVRIALGDMILAQFRTEADEIDGHVSLVPLSMAQTLGWARA